MAKQQTVPRNAEKIMVRLPEGLRERIAERAAAKHCSMNTVVVHSLESMLDDHNELSILIDSVKAMRSDLELKLKSLKEHINS